MPRELKTWGCDFRCGYLNTKRPKIEKHEQTCFSNPARRACKTCKHDVKDRDECYCALDVELDDLDEPYRPEKPDGGITAVADCPGWEARQ